MFSLNSGIENTTGSLKVEVIAWNYLCDAEIGQTEVSIESIIDHTANEPEGKKAYPLTRDGCELRSVDDFDFFFFVLLIMYCVI